MTPSILYKMAQDGNSHSVAVGRFVPAPLDSEPHRSLRHLLDENFEGAKFLLHLLNAHQEELSRTRLAVVRELEGGEHRAMIAPVLIRWAVALLSREDLGGRRPLSGGAGHEHKVQHAVERALRSDQLRWPNLGKDTFGSEEIITAVVHCLTTGLMPVEVVVTHGDDREGWLPSPGIEQTGLLMTAFIVAAIEVIDPEQQFGACRSDAEVSDEGRTHIASHIDVG